MITINISAGELADRTTILQIKQARILDPAKLHWIQKELAVHEQKLEAILGHLDASERTHTEWLIAKLAGVNSSLWIVEDQLRELEDLGQFDNHFIQLARSVYQNNDERFRLKTEINQLFNSEVREQKSYNKQ